MPLLVVSPHLTSMLAAASPVNSMVSSCRTIATFDQVAIAHALNALSPAALSLRTYLFHGCKFQAPPCFAVADSAPCASSSNLTPPSPRSRRPARARSAFPPPHSALRATAHSATARSSPFINEHVSSSSRCSDPEVSLLDIRLAAAASLPKQRAHAARSRNELAASTFCLHIPADRRVLLWTAPHSKLVHAAMEDAGIRINLQRQIFEGLLMTHVPETRESYGAGLLRFHQFCDREVIPEGARMLADRFLLAAFIADGIGSCLGKCVRNWLSGLRLWHLFNDAPWHGDEGWLPALKKSADKGSVSFKRPLRGPITNEHMRALHASLDLNSPFEAAT
ncbi:hypothetical protein B0H10DRAFT_2243552 [Mycena sp. CBHHK59/15]|nr:hypothetical protein B0H10DRAFT_2243552 [Mycena sp. CBHHK59/15]